MEREVSEVDRKLLLKKTYLDKIHYYLTRNPIDQDELYTLIRKFFSEYLKLDYEFTYEELSQELNKVFIKPKVKEHIDAFLIRLSESEYLEENALGTVEINAFLRELDDIIRNVIFDDQAPAHEENATIIQKVLNIKHKEQEKVLNISDVSMLIDEINFHITNGNLDIAKNSYVELLKEYDRLNKDDKKKLHDDMNEVYERLQTLIKNPKSSTKSNVAGVVGATGAGVAGYVAGSAGYGVDASKQNVNEYVKKVMDLAEETIFYINASNLGSAKKSYSQTLQAYESLNPEEKKIMHLRVNDLYNQLQTLSLRPKSISAEPKLATKGLSSIVDSIPEDLPELEPISESNTFIGASHSQTPSSASSTSQAASNTSSSPVSSSSVSPATSTISTASFVEEFGKSTASSKSDLSNATFFNTIGTTPETVASNASTNNNSNTVSSVNYDMSLDIESNGVNSNIASALSSSNIGKDYDIARESFAEEIDNDRLATTSGAANMLFTATSSDDIVDKTSVKTTTKVAAIAKPVVVQVAQVKPVQPVPLAPQKIPPRIETKQQIERLNPKSDLQTFDSKINAKINTPVNTKSNDVKTNDVKNITPELKRPSIVEKINTTQSTTPLQTPLKTSLQAPSQVDKLNVLLQKIDDDIIMDKFDRAKETYKEALLIYRPLRDSEKSKCYERFYFTFKKLDDALHQKSLHDILDKHLSESTQSHRPLASKKSNFSDNTEEPYIPESSKIINNTTLPVILTNDLESTRVYELIEESYFNIDNSNSDLAMLKYFKALEYYHKLTVNDKKKLYPDLYNLFKKLSIVKKAQF